MYLNTTFTAALFTIAKGEKNPMSIKEGKDKRQWCIYTMEYYIVIKRNDILINVTIYINLENIMLLKILFCNARNLGGRYRRLHFSL